MAFGFNAGEILQMAERIERNGARFYRRAAEVGGADEETKAALLELARMEEDHERTFTKMREALDTAESRSSTFDPEGETAAYLAAMADGSVFGSEADPVDLVGDKPIEELLKIAIGMERESILFYLGLRDLVPPASGRDKVEGILEEEMSHVALLRGRLTALR